MEKKLKIRNSIFSPHYFIENSETTDANLNEIDSETVVPDGIMSSAPQVLFEERDEDELIDKYVEENELEEPEETTIFNTRALPKDAPTYEIEKFEKNALIIFNQVNVDGYLKPRLGTDKDVEALTNTFENLGFDVKECKDYTKEEVFRELKSFTESDFTDYGCIAVAVLTHGTTEGLIYAKDRNYSELEILNYFKVREKPTLVTKPKILIIQACRGKKVTPGVAVMRSAKITKDFEDEPYYLPVESDMLVLHSSYVGNVSFRDEVEGSWLIQTLCRKITALAATQDLESIITEVKREVAIDFYYKEYNRRTFDVDVNKQIPVMTSTLIRKLYLRKQERESDRNPAVKQYMNQVFDSGPLGDVPDLQVDGCRCFLDHYDYIKDCLRHYLEENATDLMAKSLLEVANTIKDSQDFNTTKLSMLRAICNHLRDNTRDTIYNKYLYFYKD